MNDGMVHPNTAAKRLSFKLNLWQSLIRQSIPFFSLQVGKNSPDERPNEVGLGSAGVQFLDSNSPIPYTFR